jgi:hypothetical protein
MVKVYFETTKDGSTSDGRYAELIGIFRDEETYGVCITVLDELARNNGMILTESGEDNSIYDLKSKDENI